MKLKIDKEFEKLIPPLQDTEFSGLTKSILKYGCQEPIEIWNNTIIDGHNRYKICKANNIPFEVREMDFSDRSEALVYIIEKQFGRRNLLTFRIGLENEKRDPGKGEREASNVYWGD